MRNCVRDGWRGGEGGGRVFERRERRVKKV